MRQLIVVGVLFAVGILLAGILFSVCLSTDNHKQIDMHIKKHIIDKWYDQTGYWIRTSDYNVYETSEGAWSKITIGKDYNLCIQLNHISDSTFVYDAIVNTSVVI